MRGGGSIEDRIRKNKHETRMKEFKLQGMLCISAEIYIPICLCLFIFIYRYI